MLKRAPGIAVIVVLSAIAAYAQSAPAVAVTGNVPQPLTLTAQDLAGMPRASVAADNNGIQIVYEGVWLGEVLRRAGVPLGGELRGPVLATYVLASAADGYQVVFSLGELDPEMTAARILLADTANGQPLFGDQGSFRLVIPDDKRGARSVRMLTTIEVVRLRP